MLPLYSTWASFSFTKIVSHHLLQPSRLCLPISLASPLGRVFENQAKSSLSWNASTTHSTYWQGNQKSSRSRQSGIVTWLYADCPIHEKTTPSLWQDTHTHAWAAWENWPTNLKLLWGKFRRHWHCCADFHDTHQQHFLQNRPDTSELAMRFGLHSGPVTAGVLRGEKSRFQLFGDTVNTGTYKLTSSSAHLSF